MCVDWCLLKRGTPQQAQSVPPFRVQRCIEEEEEKRKLLHSMPERLRFPGRVCCAGKADIEQIVSEGAKSALWHTVIASFVTSQAHLSSGSPESGSW